MDTQKDADPAATPDPSPPAAGPDGPRPPEWERLVRSLEEKVAGLMEQGLARLGGELTKAKRQEAEAAFAAGHPDFQELKTSGRLEEARRANPLLDEVGAYFAARLDRERQDMAARLEEAARDAEKRVMESLRVRRQAATLGPGQGAAPDRADDPEMADPGRFGGMNAVLAKRLAARRAAAGN
ncbi:MAG: hypothetical protein RDU30_18335 [Desulfovibrionaceae bacterium]|nr:hypothetical protein [Desulfovibrionaceae bacterium]